MRLRRLLLLACAISAPAWNALAQQQPYVNEGLAALKAGKTDDAIALFSQAIQVNPQDSRAFCGRAYAYSVKRDYDNGLRDCVEALRLDPHFAKAFCVMGNIFWLTGDTDKAAESFERAASFGPNDPDVLYNCALYYLHKDNGKVIGYCMTIIDINPNNADAYYIKGNAYSDEKEYDDALRTYTEAIRLKPWNANFYHQRGMAYLNTHDLGDAIDDFSRAIQLNPKSDAEYASRGYSYAENHDYDKAVADYTQAIQINPRVGGYYLQRGLAYAQLGDKDKAKADMKIAEQLKAMPN
ncbi:MAG: tetratricopeptide repeat protein [Chthoniobacteraceae bacterium]|jgi:tetratricopeptide (TPR) repeat protein